MRNVLEIPSGMLLTEYRDAIMKLALDVNNKELRLWCDQLEEQIDRRMSW